MCNYLNCLSYQDVVVETALQSRRFVHTLRYPICCFIVLSILIWREQQNSVYFFDLEKSGYQQGRV